MFAQTCILAVLLDAVLGDPQSFYIHPVILIGKVINFWHRNLFISSRDFLRGLLLCIITLLTSFITVLLLLYFTDCNILVKIFLLYSALAWKDLKDETAPILECLIKNDIVNARLFLSRVVGRDTDKLNESQIVRAVIETIAENSVDGIISVLFFAALGQLIDANYGACICVWLFKTASTLDSMIGYESLSSYGKASAKLDDALNFLPARLGGLVIVLAGRKGFKVFMNDRLKHKSPNSAHGESAFAGALDVRLGGGAFYSGVFEPREYLNAEGKEPEIFDIVRAWKLLDTSCSIFVILVILFSCII